jgi:hypothetical protein
MRVLTNCAAASQGGADPYEVERKMARLLGWGVYLQVYKKGRERCLKKKLS